MTPSRITVFLLASIAMLAACKKEATGDVKIFYGTWVNQTGFGDTLYFSKKNGKNVMSYLATAHNPSSRRESDYKVENGILVYRFLGGVDFVPVQGFKWNIVGHEFEWNANMRFPYLSSIPPPCVYRKLP
jgi:hypothetical protein